jgi:cell wall-associated NlpC family hydrolase
VPATPFATTTARRALRTGAVLSLAGALALSTVLSASAEPGPVYPSEAAVDRARSAVAGTAGRIASLDAQFAAASARLAQVQDAAASAAEAYNGTRLELARRTAETAAAKKRAAQAQAVADAAGREVRRYAVNVYQQGGSLGELEAYLSSTGPQDLVDRATALQAVGDARARTLQKADATAVVASTMRRQAARAEAAQVNAASRAQKARDAARAQADAARATAASIEGQQAGLVTQLASLRRTSVDLERQRQDGLAAAAAARTAAAQAARQAQLAAERAATARTRAAREAAARAAAEAARQRAAAERAAQDAQKPRPKPPAPADPPPPPPPSSGGVSAVIDYARAQIGKDYQWGGAGPDTFDCSGLTMRAWQRAGVYLSHYTGAQWAETSRVAISDLRPGDLVFFGSSGATSHHMGLYIGGGQMIEAPYTGAQVRYASIYRSDLVPYGGRP